MAYETLLVLCQYEIDKKNGLGDVMDTLKTLGVTDLFIGKTSSQLDELQAEVKAMLNAGGAIDVAYWESVYKASHIFKARAVLSEMHAEIMAKRTELFGDLPEIVEYVPNNDSKSEEKTNVQRGDDSPVESITSTEFDESKLEEQRLHYLEKHADKLYQRSKIGDTESGISSEDILWKRESEKGLDENEEEFTSEVALKKQEYAWNDLHRPRKPKYYNRIKTGFEWNKYNQTHYDQDNPPPKIIQGYKFNIFYPDLIDPTKSPSYHVEKSDEDTTIIRFHAGPPYEDIAFRIVNKEWESSHRKGYRCVFDRGVLQLWFNFKRYRYRR